jgi:hypothetical protein
MANPTFTINAATELLESDRRKIQKALRNVPPDAKVKGQQQWRIKTILDALDRLPGAVKATRKNNSNRSSLSNDEFVTQMFEQNEAFTRASDALVALGEMPKRLRRAEAKHVFAKIDTLVKLFEKAEPDGLSEHPLSIVQQMMSGLLWACDLELDPSEFPDDDD